MNYLAYDSAYCVININDDEITAINYSSGKKEIILPERFFLMKDTSYVLKVENLLGNILNGTNKMDNMMKYFMMSKMTEGIEEKTGNMLSMMMMSGGKFGEDNLFGKKAKKKEPKSK